MRRTDGWVARLDAPGGSREGPRVAVKDAIAVAGLPTRVGGLATPDTPGPRGAPSGIE